MSDIYGMRDIKIRLCLKIKNYVKRDSFICALSMWHVWQIFIGQDTRKRPPQDIKTIRTYLLGKSSMETSRQIERRTDRQRSEVIKLKSERLWGNNWTTHRALSLAIGLRQIGIQLCAMASRIGGQLLGTVVPHYERRWLQGAAHNAAQDHIAASLDIAIGLTQDFGARNCKERQKRRDKTYYDMLTITQHTMMMMMMMFHGQRE